MHTPKLDIAIQIVVAAMVLKGLWFVHEANFLLSHGDFNLEPNFNGSVANSTRSSAIRDLRS